jgi:hypothetical protein
MGRVGLTERKRFKVIAASDEDTQREAPEKCSDRCLSRAPCLLRFGNVIACVSPGSTPERTMVFRSVHGHHRNGSSGWNNKENTIAPSTMFQGRNVGKRLKPKPKPISVTEVGLSARGNCHN